MEEWKEYRIKDLGEVVTGNTPPTSNREYYGTEYKFIKPTDMVEGQRFVLTTEEYYSKLAYQKYKKCLLPPKTPCVVTIGSLGKKMCLTDTECFTNQAVNAVIPNKENDGEFLYYAFKASVLAYVKQLDSGTTSGRENVSKSSFSKIKVRVPYLHTQQKIATILSTYDNLIQNYKKQIEALQTAASELYKEWFVRFRFPGYQTTKFENGIPEGWKIERVGNYAKVKSGFAFKSEWWQEEGYPVVKIKDINDGKIDITNLDYVSQEHTYKAKAFLLQEGDMVIAMTGATIGKVGIVPKIANLYTNQRVGKFFLGNNPYSSVPFLYCLFSQNSTVETVYCLSGASSAQPNISPDQIESIKFFYNEEIVNKFNNQIEPYFRKIGFIRQQITNLTQQRDLLLPRLMSGKLEV